jgi:hypothetical protein
VFLAGFGADESGTLGELRGVTTSITDVDCSAHDCRAGFEFTAGGAGRDTCVGDSGGPAYLTTPRGTFVAGVTSRNAVPGSDCGSGGIYTRVDDALEWIRNASGRSIPAATCSSGPQGGPESTPPPGPDDEREANEGAASGGGSDALGGCSAAGRSDHWLMAAIVLVASLLRRRRGEA